MNKSDSIMELAKALNKAQDQMGGAVKDAANPFFKSKYADLSSVVKAVKQPFADNGISYSQFPLTEDGMVGVETILMHVSGEWIASKLLLPVTKKDPQAAGSAITYARRYALQAAAGIPSEDDDGNLGSVRGGGNVRPSNFVLDDNAKWWVDAVKVNPAKLEELNDKDFKQFIKNNAGL